MGAGTEWSATGFGVGIITLFCCMSMIYTKVWQIIRDNNDSLESQKDLQLVEAWSEKWLLRFNAAKCKIMHMGRDSGIKYHLWESKEQKELIGTDLERDLGIMVSKDLKWGEQCGKAAKKAMSVLGMIRRTFDTRMIDEKVLSYCTTRMFDRTWNIVYRLGRHILRKI